MKIKEDSKLLKTVVLTDKIVGGIIDNLGGFMIAFIWLMVLFCVVCRYILHISTGGYDEFNTYFLSLVIWTGSVTTARKFEDGHVNIDLVGPYIKSDRVRAIIKCLWQLVAITTCVIFSKCSYDYMLYLMKRGTSMSGVDFPMWIFIAVMLLCSVLLVVYETVYLLALIFGRILGWIPYSPFGFIPRKTDEDVVVEKQGEGGASE